MLASRKNRAIAAQLGRFRSRRLPLFGSGRISRTLGFDASVHGALIALRSFVRRLTGCGLETVNAIPERC
jgi:hypothetical protein